MFITVNQLAAAVNNLQRITPVNYTGCRVFDGKDIIIGTSLVRIDHGYKAAEYYTGSCGMQVYATATDKSGNLYTIYKGNNGIIAIPEY